MVTHLQCRVTNWKQWLFAAGFWGNKGKSGGLNVFFFSLALSCKLMLSPLVHESLHLQPALLTFPLAERST